MAAMRMQRGRRRRTGQWKMSRHFVTDDANTLGRKKSHIEAAFSPPPNTFFGWRHVDHRYHITHLEVTKLQKPVSHRFNVHSEELVDRQSDWLHGRPFPPMNLPDTRQSRVLWQKLRLGEGTSSLQFQLSRHIRV